MAQIIDDNEQTKSPYEFSIDDLSEEVEILDATGADEEISVPKGGLKKSRKPDFKALFSSLRNRLKSKKAPKMAPPGRKALYVKLAAVVGIVAVATFVVVNKKLYQKIPFLKKQASVHKVARHLPPPPIHKPHKLAPKPSVTKKRPPKPSVASQMHQPSRVQTAQSNKTFESKPAFSTKPKVAETVKPTSAPEKTLSLDEVVKKAEESNLQAVLDRIEDRRAEKQSSALERKLKQEILELKIANAKKYPELFVPELKRLWTKKEKLEEMNLKLEFKKKELAFEIEKKKKLAAVEREIQKQKELEELKELKEKYAKLEKEHQKVLKDLAKTRKEFESTQIALEKASREIQSMQQQKALAAKNARLTRSMNPEVAAQQGLLESSPIYKEVQSLREELRRTLQAQKFGLQKSQKTQTAQAGSDRSESIRRLLRTVTVKMIIKDEDSGKASAYVDFGPNNHMMVKEGQDLGVVKVAKIDANGVLFYAPEVSKSFYKPISEVVVVGSTQALQRANQEGQGTEGQQSARHQQGRQGR